MSPFFQLLVFISILAVSSQFVVAQSDLEPTKDKALITLHFFNPETKEVWRNLKIMVHGNKMITNIHKLTDDEGNISLLLPVGDKYQISPEDSASLGSIEIAKGGFQKHTIPIPYNGDRFINNSISNEKEIMVKLVLETHSGHPNPSVEKIQLYDEIRHITYQVQTNEEGQAAIRLPRNSRLQVSLQGAPNYYCFNTPATKYDIWEERILFERKLGYHLFPDTKHGLINFRYIDMDGQTVPNERFEVENKHTGKKYHCTTNQYGIAQIKLPLGNHYLFSTAHNPYFEQMDVKLKEGYDIFEFEVLYQSPCTEEWAKRVAEVEALSTFKDSVVRLAMTEKMDLPSPKRSSPSYLDRDIPIKNLKTFKVRRATEKKAKIYRDSLKQNPKVFPQYNKPILSALNRFKDHWKSKIIVTDVTASMDPYIEEILIWHALNLIKGIHAKYVFFNDGDNKQMHHKEIGKTGGIYFCEGGLGELEQIIAKMKEATLAKMRGGEPSENDIEALLAGIEKRDSIEEVILVADAHSRIRDMKLLIKIDCPIRIILCGAEEKNNSYFTAKDLNEQYLTIAHRTGGSIHTLSKDIWDLSQKSDGDVIELQGIRYLLKNHQFIKL